MDLIGAIIAGLAGTVVFSMLMMLGPMMGMPKMEIWAMLGSMFNPKGNLTLGWILHLMMGAIFGIIYAYLWSIGVGSVTLLSGAIFGLVHFLIIGLMMGLMPMLHAGMKSGDVTSPGFFMLNAGIMGFMGGLLLHIIFGIIVAWVYGYFI